MNTLGYQRPVDIARSLGISTSTLRHYEAWGIVPPVQRAENGYRSYREEHIAYFRCIRQMEPGFCLKLTGGVMRQLINGSVDAALWMVAEAKEELVRERKIAEQAIRILDLTQSAAGAAAPDIRTIGDVARLTHIPVTAIRYWERCGLYTVERDPNNGYRMITNQVLKKILLIRTLRTGGYSVNTIKKMLDRMDLERTDEAKEIAIDSLRKLERRNREQLRGEHALYELCQALGLL